MANLEIRQHHQGGGTCPKSCAKSRRPAPRCRAGEKQRGDRGGQAGGGAPPPTESQRQRAPAVDTTRPPPSDTSAAARRVTQMSVTHVTQTAAAAAADGRAYKCLSDVWQTPVRCQSFSQKTSVSQAGGEVLTRQSDDSQISVLLTDTVVSNAYVNEQSHFS